MSKLKEKLENSLVYLILSAFVIGFIGGNTVIEKGYSLFQLELIYAPNYKHKAEYDKLKFENDQLKNKIAANFTSLIGNDGNKKSIIIDPETATWNYTDDGVTAEISYRFLNCTDNTLNCVVEFSTGYQNGIEWVQKEAKKFSFLIQANGTYTLNGEMPQFAVSVSENCLLTYKIISANPINS